MRACIVSPDLKMDTWMHARMYIKMDDNSVGQWLSEWMGGCMDGWIDGKLINV